MKLLVLGASGGCGQWVVRLARERGHEVRALVRPESNPPAGAEVLHGSVLDASVIERALDGQDAVVSCLGLRRKSPNPFSALVSPPDLTSNAARVLVEVLARRGRRRVVAISAAGVADSSARAHWFIRFMIGRGSLGAAYRDLARMEELYAAGLSDWLAVRPVTLVDGPPTGRAAVVDRYRLGSKIARADVATWMLDSVEAAGSPPERAVMIGWA